MYVLSLYYCFCCCCSGLRPLLDSEDRSAVTGQLCPFQAWNGEWPHSFSVGTWDRLYVMKTGKLLVGHSLWRREEEPGLLCKKLTWLKEKKLELGLWRSGRSWSERQEGIFPFWGLWTGITRGRAPHATQGCKERCILWLRVWETWLYSQVSLKTSRQRHIAARF